jgi:hypothetical protein
MVDDDCKPQPEWLQAVAAQFARTSVISSSSGRTLNALADNPYSSASEIILAVMYDHILGTLVAHFGFIALGVSANPAVLPRSLIFIRRFSFFLHQRLSQLRQPAIQVGALVIAS